MNTFNYKIFDYCSHEIYISHIGSDLFKSKLIINILKHFPLHLTFFY